MALKNIHGKVKKCGAFPLKSPIPNAFEDGKTWTHRLAIQMDDDNWYGFGNTDKEDFIVKNPEDQKWAVLGAGSEVLIQYELSDDGKYRNAKKSNLTVLNLVKGKSFSKNNSGGGSSDGGTPFDPTGMRVGHAINSAMFLGMNQYKKPADILEVAKQLHDVSAQVEAKYKELNPNMSAKDIGAASGNAVHNACKLKASTSPLEKVGEIYKTALALLVNVVPALTEYVKGESAATTASDDSSANSNDNSEAEAAAAEQKAAKEKAAKEAAEKKKKAEAAAKKKEAEAKKKAEEAAKAAADVSSTGGDDFDEDLPAGFGELDDVGSMGDDLEF